jgi:hypothetical protein
MWGATRLNANFRQVVLRHLARELTLTAEDIDSIIDKDLLPQFEKDVKRMVDFRIVRNYPFRVRKLMPSEHNPQIVAETIILTG